MDIKLKDIKYSWGTKALAIVLVWLCFAGAMGSCLLIINNRVAENSKSYFDTYRFKYEFASLVYNAAKAELLLKSEENIRASSGNEASTMEDIENYRDINNWISGSVNFKYLISSAAEGMRITNADAANPVADIENQPGYIYIGKEQSKYSLPVYKAEIEEMLRNTDYEIYAAVQQPLKPGDRFYDDYTAYTRAKLLTAYAYPVLAVSGVLLVIAAFYLALVAGIKEEGGGVTLLPIDRVYTDVHTVLVMFAAFLSLNVSVEVYGGSVESWIATFLVLTADAFIGISYCMSMIRQAKSGVLLKNTLAAVVWKKIVEFLRLCFAGEMFRPALLAMLLVYGTINGILFDLGIDVDQGYQIPLITVLLIAFNAAAVYASGKALNSLSTIMLAAREISSGNIDYALNANKVSIAFKGLAEDIENIQGGLKNAVSEAVKGERMKTELITNVSHDLKTPLTSVVNYVDLLKKESLNNQRAEEYISVLEEKTGRLKQLVEDLVEASKATSGNLTVSNEKVDLHELVLQACGEYEDKIKKAALDIRIDSEEKNTFILADGKHMWRIIENLLSNTIKYSMPNSRIYISMGSSSRYGTMVIKNISAFPLNIPPEQLTERFVRGDESRTTEGSGLGLSIAQSLAVLQGGRFWIEIDGDLFKANLEMPLFSDAKSSMV